MIRPFALSAVFVLTAPAVLKAQDPVNFSATGRLSFFYGHDEFYPFGPPWDKTEGISGALDLSLAAWMQTPSGLGFGGQVDLEDFGPAGEGDVDAFGYVYGTNWSTSLGNSDDAFDFALDEIGAGDTAGEKAKLARLDTGGNSGLLYTADDPVVLRQTVSFGDFDFALSVARIASDDRAASAEMEHVYAAGLRWDRDTPIGNFRFGAGFQKADGETFFGPDVFIRRGVQLGWAWQGIEVILNHSEGPIIDPAGGGLVYDSDYSGASVSYTRDGWTVGGNFGRQETGSCSGSGFDGQGRGAWIERELAGGFKLTASHGYVKYFCGGKRFRETSVGVVKRF